MNITESVKLILIVIGVAHLFETFLPLFGLWTSISWGGKNSDHPGWWLSRQAPIEREWKKL